MQQAVEVVLGGEQFIGKSDSKALSLLNKPTIMYLKGKSQKKAVLVSVMLHGSEPCGFRAFLQEVQRQRIYPFDVYFFIGNVKAAQLEPVFSNRFVPGDVNYNRIWSSNSEHPVAHEVVEFFSKIPLIAVLDIHSFTTKKQIPHCFITSNRYATLKMAQILAPHVLISEVSQGTLIEQFGQRIPACTIECGTNNTSQADAYAIETLNRFFRYVEISNGTNDSICKGVYHHEVNVKLRPEASVCWAERKKKGYNLTLRNDCEELNLTLAKAGTVIGWTDALEYFRVVQGSKEIEPAHVFCIKDGALVLTHDLVPTLISTSEMIIKESGFYLFEPYQKD